MARMNSLERLGAALAAQQPMPAPGRAPGDVTTTPVSGTPRYDLLMRLGVPSLPPDSRLSDSLVASLMMGEDAQVTKDKFRALFCVPPGPFYCEDERTQWMNENPWCAGAVVPIVTTPTFTSDVERNAFIATHQHCPTPPPVLTDHMCTPGDPGCAPATSSSSAASNGAGTFFLGAAVIATLWWLNTPSTPRSNPDVPSAKDRLAGLYQRALAADAEFSEELRKAYGSSAGDMRYRTQKQTAKVKAAGKRYEDAMADFANARNEHFTNARNGRR
ncbi:MAG: hypothetical protein ABI652_00970 [Acidobacteriota bacterium]